MSSTLLAERTFQKRYRVMRLLGAGAQGRVYQVADLHVGDEVALKMVGPEHRDVIAAEFGALSQLHHPNVARAIDLEILTRATDEHPAGSVFFTSELVRGRELGAALPSSDRNAWLRRCLDGALAGLEALHEHALVHADIKPSNVLVRDDGRVVLVDFGLSTSPAPVRGTLPFMAPEALAGTVAPAADLYSLGATFWAVVAGRVPYSGDTLAEIARKICAAERPELHTLAPWLEPDLQRVIEALLDPEPSKRPRSAAEVRAALRRGASQELADLGRAPLLGLEPLVAEVVAALGQLARGQRACVIIRGQAGSGRTTLLELAKHRYQLRATAGAIAPATFRQADLDELGGIGEAATIADRVARAAIAKDPSAIWVIDAPADERSQLLARAVCVDRELEVPPLLLLSEDESLAASDRVVVIDITPLGDSDARALARRQNPDLHDADLDRIVTSAAGNPGMVIELCRDPDDPERGAGYRALAARQIAGMPTTVVDLLALLAAALTPIQPERAAGLLRIEVEALWRATAVLLEARWIRRSPDGFEVESKARADAACAALPADVVRAAYLRLLEAGVGAGWRRARYALGAGQQCDADLVQGAADELVALGRRRDALELLSQSMSLATSLARPAIAESAARVAVVLGQYRRAIELTEAGIAVASSDASRHRLLRVQAEALARSGQRATACEVLRRALDAVADRDTRARLGRLLVDLGSYDEALALLQDDARADVISGPVAEATGLALFYRGDIEGSTARFEAAESWARERGEEQGMARALGLQGMVAQAAGRIVQAASYFDRAAIAARRAGDVHAAAVYLLNRAAADFERGRYSSALDSADRARGRFARLGDVAELAGADYNLGLAALAIGDLETARSSAERAVAEAQRHNNTPMHVYGLVLSGDVSRRTGEMAAAEASYRRAVELADQSSLGRDAGAVRRNLAELLAELGRDEAWSRIEEAADLESSADDRDRLLLTRARVALELDPGRAPTVTAIAAIAERSRASGRDDLAWRAELVAARLATAAGDAHEARRLVDAALETVDALTARQPRLAQAGLSSDPDHRALRAMAEQLDVGVDGDGDRASDAEVERLRRLLSVSRRLNSELRLRPLLDLVLDTAVDLARAERGMLVLRDAAGQLEVVSARGGGIELALDDSPAGDGAQLSRSVVNRAIERGEVVLSAHAGADERFEKSVSVAAMGLRSVLAVPLRDKSTIIGSLVLDHRFRRGAFDEVAVTTVRELAAIAGVAIGNARLAQLGQERQKEIDALNRQLQREVDNTRGQLDDALAKLATESERRLRYDYDAIVGRSPKMVDLLQLVDRATDTDLPVVIVGESGTGKELIARALHQNGKRAKQAFVAVNCGALPEPLLESELFGHARGAFTGAQRDRRGLFEVADGGTLFLDELGDMSLPMQAKLLRVLQDGELRRVGDDRPRRVDVRVVAALNRSLDALVAAGSFREDLYYRLNVLQVAVPALRERLEDLPSLAAHVLARLGGKTLARDALDLLLEHDWPGNVRELENELTRAATMASADKICLTDLSPRLVAAAEESSRSGRDLDLKARVSSLERQLLRRALRETGGNQSQAAKLLGLSRYGLQKKLKRYEMDAREPAEA